MLSVHGEGAGGDGGGKARGTQRQTGYVIGGTQRCAGSGGALQGRRGSQLREVEAVGADGCARRGGRAGESGVRGGGRAAIEKAGIIQNGDIILQHAQFGLDAAEGVVLLLDRALLALQLSLRRTLDLDELADQALPIETGREARDREA